MMDRLNNPSKIEAYRLADELKDIVRYFKSIWMISFQVNFQNMMIDWDNDDVNLLTWRAATAETNFEKTVATTATISEQEYFDNGVLMIAMVKAGVELALKR
jgi:ketol-acid reductoisomerase